MSERMADQEHRILERLLRQRGTALAGNPKIERTILERFQDDCAILVLDTSGFTRLTQKHGIIHFLALLIDLHDRVKPIVARHQPLGCWGEADNMFATFPGPRWALQCALEIRRRERAINTKRGQDERLDICMGIGSGRMLRIGDSECYGHPMNLACKLGEDLARPGEILITEEVHAAVAPQVSGLHFAARRKRISGMTLKYAAVETRGAVKWARVRNVRGTIND